ncbi:hypothetical protein ONZ45_g332 [Pleurotus djamor]|nr:hypothetical protein ONZ45_g332 [Pleurotus djamor]
MSADNQFRARAEPLLNVWIYLNLVVNTVLLPILVATFLLSKRAKRHATLVNVCMVWVLSGIFSLLLFYAGQYDPKTPEPNKFLCIAQTSLLYGITPMWSTAVLMLVLQLRLSFSNYRERSRQLWFTVLTVAAPYIILMIFFTATLAISQSRPNEVTRNRRVLYCTLHYTPLYTGMAIVTAIVCFAVTCLEVQLGLILYRNWRAIRSARRASGAEIALLLRVFLFGIYVFIGMVVNVFTVFDRSSVFPDIFAATIGLVVFIIFGTQTDVLHVWCFWLRNKPTKPEPVYLSGLPNWSYSIDLVKSATPSHLEKGGFSCNNGGGDVEKLAVVHLTPPPPVARK